LAQLRKTSGIYEFPRYKNIESIKRVYMTKLVATLYFAFIEEVVTLILVFMDIC